MEADVRDEDLHFVFFFNMFILLWNGWKRYGT